MLTSFSILMISIFIAAGIVLTYTLVSGIDSSAAKYISLTCLIAFFGLGSLWMYHTGQKGDEEVIEFVGKIEELEQKQKEIEQKKEDKMYHLLEKELKTSKDKLIVERNEEFTKVTSDRGVFKVNFSYDSKGNIIGIGEMNQVMKTEN
ncbi:hypothetical protein COO03_04890 [Bacillus sp. AFS098217]|uniref:hypothetical protein n=1 Tax=Bacillus sp. AFS098217 TaxID=2033868 RepID=UPI000BEB75E9|nr:hypothetical protein [Bacillus sp. AFS098217]PEB54579.1 hypothetical protein COO03_04890 [Bacillus sp. AFS098217]